MSTDRDVTRIVRSWLNEDRHEDADRVLNTVLDQLDTTPQRRSWWSAWRHPVMNNTLRIALAAAAVVVVALIGYQFLFAPTVGGPAPVETPTPTSEPTVTPAPSRTSAFPPAGELATTGRHSMTLEGVTFTFSVPTGWVSNGIFGIDRSAGIGPDGAGFIFWIDAPVGVFSDPCSETKGPALGTSAVDLAAAVAAVPGTDLTSGPTDVTVGGYAAKYVVITIREDIGCAPNNFYLWYAPSPTQARYATSLGSTIRTWIVDVDGTIVWIDGETYKGAGPEPGQELQQIVDSIQFE